MINRNFRGASAFKLLLAGHVFTVVFLGAILLLPILVDAQQNLPPPPPTLMDTIRKLLPMCAVIMVIFHFMVLKPQADKEIKLKKMLEGLTKGDTVVTSGGIIGRVSSIENDFILLEVASNVKVKVEKSHIALKKEPEVLAA